MFVGNPKGYFWTRSLLNSPEYMFYETVKPYFGSFLAKRGLFKTIFLITFSASIYICLVDLFVENFMEFDRLTSPKLLFNSILLVLRKNK